MPIDTFNLIYHITPFADAKETWQANSAPRCCGRINLFSKPRGRHCYRAGHEPRR